MADCTKTSWPGIPNALIDLVDPSTYGGFSGSLYEGNSNTPPAGHATKASEAASAIIRRDTNGDFSPTGKKVLLSVGMSNATQEFQAFMAIADPASDVVIVDGAQSARDATEWSNPASDVWATVDSRLAAKGVTAEQVSAIWAKHAVAGVTGSFPTHAQTLQGYLKDFVLEVKTRYPNCKIIYFSSRTYGGYNDTAANPEPYAYESGFAVKWLIEAQSAATDPDLAYATTPVLLWGPYLWSNGTTANSEGLSWDCSDFESDGLHPSATGEAKVAAKLNTFFTTSTYTTWYRSATNITTLGTLADGTDQSTYTLTNITIAAYQLALVAVFTRQGSATPVAPTLAGHSLTWTQFVTRPFHTEATPRARATWFWAVNNSATPVTDDIVATFAGPQTQVCCAMLAIGMTGVDQVGPIAQSNANSVETQTNIQVALLNPQALESSVVAVTALATLGNNITPKSGWTEPAGYDIATSSPTTKFELAYNELFDTPATSSWGANTTSAAMLIAEIKAATLSEPTVHEGAASMTGAGELDGAGQLIAQSQAALDGAGLLTGVGQLVVSGVATLAGTAELSPAGEVVGIGRQLILPPRSFTIVLSERSD